MWTLAFGARMPINVAFPDPPAPELLPVLTEHLHPDLRLHVAPEPSPETRILVSGLPKREWLTALSQLEMLIVPYTGLPKATRKMLLEVGHLRVHSLRYNSEATAEMAVALLLTAAKRLLPVDHAFRESHWLRHEPHVGLSGESVLVLGYGSVGRRVADKLAALGMTVHAVCRRPRPETASVPLLAPDTWREALPAARAVVVCLPLTEATTGMIGEMELAAMSPSCVVVNVGRGPVVDEAALYRALAERRIFGAGLDVWWRYPEAGATIGAPSVYPFNELDNVVMSPHRASRLEDGEERRLLALADSLKAFAAGKPVPYPVDVRAGY